MNISDIQITYNSFMPNVNMSKDNEVCIKSLPYLSIVQSTVGSYDIKIDNSPTYSTGDGGFFIAPSSAIQTITHRFSPTEHKMLARWLFVDVKINGFYPIDDCFSFPIVLGKEESIELNKSFDRLTYETDFCERQSIIYHILGFIISRAKEKNVAPECGIDKAIKYIHDNYSRHIDIPMLSEIALMSQSNFFAVFKKRYGCSPIEYTNNIRISIAQERLLRTDKQINEIAAEVGISDPFYFCRLFKKNCNMSPRDYRNGRNVLPIK